jgi:hypothetical protein
MGLLVQRSKSRLWSAARDDPEQELPGLSADLVGVDRVALTIHRTGISAPAPLPREVRCICGRCGCHAIALAARATLGGNCGNCGSYELAPLDE